jgi:ubiquinol-cytochrome c reductase cytochrome b subunit
MALRLFIVVVAFGSWGGLTLASAIRDWRDGEFQASRQQCVALAARARILADQDQIPPEGAAELLRNDAHTQGPLLFARHCAGCHPYRDHAGQGIASLQPSAPNLHGFASPDWIAGLLDRDQIATPRYFGNTKLAAGDMASAVTDVFEGADDAEAKTELRGQLKKVARALSAQAGLPSQADSDKREAPAIAEGTKLLTADLGCTECHRFNDHGELGSAPDLTGYGSRAWLKGMIANPQHERFYPKELNDRMPAFAESPQNSAGNILSGRELDLLVDWLRGDQRPAFVSP